MLFSRFFLKYFAKFIFSPYSLQFTVPIQNFILIIFQTLSLRERERERESLKYKREEKKSLIVCIPTIKNLIFSVNEFYVIRGIHWGVFNPSSC